jgi:hypothetical protein
MAQAIRQSGRMRLRLPHVPDLTSFEERAREWDTAVSGLLVPGPDNSQDVVIALLEKQLVRATATIKLNDDKAAL